MSDEQFEMFPYTQPEAILHPPKPKLGPNATISQALEPFREHMIRKEFAANTIAAFSSDMAMFCEYTGSKTRLADISTADLKAFLAYLRDERDAPCSPKSLARRLTTLKVFFGWLVQVGVLSQDVSAELAHKPVQSPLPTVLSETAIQRVLEVTGSMRDASDSPDARPHLLITLLLATGIKKAECMRVTLGDIDLSRPGQPALRIRYEKPRQRFKNRLIGLPPDWPDTLQRYVWRYQPQVKLFECTGRNLEYVLHMVSTVSGLHTKLTFEMLRWTCAVRSFQDGMDPERLRKRLGLSQMAWRNTLPVIEQLTEEPL